MSSRWYELFGLPEDRPPSRRKVPTPDAEALASDLSGDLLRQVVALGRPIPPRGRGPSLFAKAAQRGNVEVWKILLEQNQPFHQDDLLEGSCKFIITLFRKGVLTVERHDMLIMTYVINSPKHQPVVEFLHTRGVAVDIYLVAKSCGVRTACLLLRSTTLSGLLDRYVAQCRETPEVLREDVAFLLDNGARFSSKVFDESVLTSRNVGHVEHFLVPANFEEGRGLREAATEHASDIASHRPSLFHLVDVSAIPNEKVGAVIINLVSKGYKNDALRIVAAGREPFSILSPRPAAFLAVLAINRDVYGLFARMDASSVHPLVLQTMLYNGVALGGTATRIAVRGDVSLWPCSRYPTLTSVKGVEAWLAAGKTPRFMLTVHRKCGKVRGRKNVGLVALAALLRFDPCVSKERHGRRIRQLTGTTRKGYGEGEDGDADVELGIALRAPRYDLPEDLWRRYVLPALFRLELPVDKGPWNETRRVAPSPPMGGDPLPPSSSPPPSPLPPTAVASALIHAPCERTAREAAALLAAHIGAEVGLL